MPPKVLTKNGDRGVLPVSSTARAAAKAPAPRLKLEIRRLPPGLTLSEFEEVMGDEWKLGNGKVDWREYRQGKVKHGLGKVAEQSRCYIHVLNEPLVKELEARFLAVTFHDAAGTHKNSDLRHLPPTMGFAMMQRIPTTSKIRADNRQGTIDTDAEFIAFLEEQTLPIVKPAALDSVNTDKDVTEKVKVKTTPLIEAIREKKASKAKATASKDDKKDTKGHARKDSKEATVVAKEGKGGKPQQQKVEQASKEAVKALNKQVAVNKQQPQQRTASPQQPVAKGPAAAGKGKKAGPNAKAQNATPSQPAAPIAPAAATGAQTSGAQRQRQRGNNAEGIKKMLQKDLGIKPKATPTGPKDQAAGARPSTPASGNTKTKDKPSPAPNTPAANSPKIPTGPKQQTQAQQNNAAQSSGNVSTTKAYLKHANPSQGMSEVLIQQVLSQYGDVQNVTIDPRKGTAIAIFKSPDGLKKALEAKKVAVANGSIEMLEFRDRNGGGNAGGGSRGGFRGGRGGARGGRAGGTATGGQAAAPAKAVGKPEGGS